MTAQNHRNDARRYAQQARHWLIRAENADSIESLFTYHDRASHYAIKALAALSMLETELGLEFSQ